jgi:hypothetical protein
MGQGHVVHMSCGEVPELQVCGSEIMGDDGTWE